VLTQPVENSGPPCPHTEQEDAEDPRARETSPMTLKTISCIRSRSIWPYVPVAKTAMTRCNSSGVALGGMGICAPAAWAITMAPNSSMGHA